MLRNLSARSRSLLATLVGRSAVAHRRRSRHTHRRRPIGAELLESRAMLATTATLSGDLSGFTQIPVTFLRPDGSVGFSRTAYVGQLGWSAMTGDAAAAGFADKTDSAGRVKVFSSAGTVVLEQGRLSTPIVGGGSPQPFWIEAFAPSASMADIAFTLTATGTGTASSDKILATAVAVDLSIDDLPADIEDGSGAYVWRNSDFTRRINAPDSRQTEAGVTRYLPDYTLLTTIDPAFADQFTKGRATFTAGMATACRFRFDVGDPASVALWTTTQWDGFVAAGDGWWRIPTNTDVRPERIADTTLDFWIEGLQSTGYAAGSIAFTALHTAMPTAARPTDVATFTVLDAGLGVDGNRDGTIDFADSYDRQLTFWLNGDRETLEYVDPDAWFNSTKFETDNASGDGEADSADGVLHPGPTHTLRRDLQDFEEVGGIPAGHPSPHGDALLVVDLLQQADREAFQPGNIVSQDAITDTTFVLPEGNVQTPMQCVLDAPMPSDACCELFDTDAK